MSCVAVASQDMAEGCTPPLRTFAFVFPMASGHINPSLPVARALVAAGHTVHYLCREQMREAIEDTGATFHSDVEHEPELYSGREPDIAPCLVMRKEYGLEDVPFMELRAKLRAVALELTLPGVLRWLQQVRADAILYDPLINFEAAYAGKVLGIPSVALLTIAGPGAYPKLLESIINVSGWTEEDMIKMVDTFEPHVAAVERMNKAYALEFRVREGFDPMGYMTQLEHSTVTVVTTSEDLQDPMSLSIQGAYQENGVLFEAVGPLLDVEGSCRAGGHKYHQESDKSGESTGAEQKPSSTQADIMAAVRAARAANRPIVLVSMGTVITGDSSLGWNARDQGTADGVLRGLSGRELCQGAWGGAIDTFGRQDPQEGPLLILALGPQPDALGPLELPANCLAAPTLPQVDILKAGVKIFLTHGGQNSFTEGLANGTPLVVCPGFGDQIVNGSKAEALGAGLQVPRPHPELEAVEQAAVQYRTDVAQALCEVYTREDFAEVAARCMERLQRAGGVPRMVELMLEAASVGDRLRQGADAKVAETKQQQHQLGCQGRSPAAAAGA